jgi:hypothetical protein
MKAWLSFRLPEEQEDFQTSVDAWKYRSALDEVWEQVFRPYHKHGYADSEINSLLENEDCRKLLEKLETLFSEASKLDD